MRAVYSIFTILIFLFSPIGLAQNEASPIRAKSIADLREELAEAGEASSDSRQRRAYKSVARDGEDLIENHPDAPNRWAVLEIVFQSQKRLFALEKSEDNRDDLLETCTQLATAPDEVADLRLEADLLLSERDLSAKNADVEERTQALADLVGRYRDTPGEAKCLMVTSQIAPKLEAFDLEVQILRAMQERFADHHGVIEFRRKSLAAGRIEARFRGAFTDLENRTIEFPIDRMGHPSILVFWSKQTTGYDVALQQMNEYATEFPDRFDYYSLNLDELPDAGASILKGHGLQWTPMHLPGGKNHQVFRTFGRRDPVAVLVNAYGYTLLTPTNSYGRGHGGAKTNPYRFDDVRITSDRYLAQLQSLFIGDFLVPDLSEHQEIAACFASVPHRYRLSTPEAQANYKKAAQLCADALVKTADTPDSWKLLNARLIALVGQWKTSTQPEHLETAATEAARALESWDGPVEASIVPRFVLAKQALRGGTEDPSKILADLLDSTKDQGEEAIGTALASAVILALDANSRELHEHYREQFLAKHADRPSLWPVTVFLRDRFHNLDLLKVKLSRGERRIRSRYGDFV